MDLLGDLGATDQLTSSKSSKTWNAMEVATGLPVVGPLGELTHPWFHDVPYSHSYKHSNTLIQPEPRIKH